ncbi:MAG: hypothetical protein UZ21_OP11001000925 [Microgenomates bacterium OLB22]|nr:MAG: hypothetical protein UZ21_OP11001000925 [Microgenomates bacterium OLB22]
MTTKGPTVAFIAHTLLILTYLLIPLSDSSKTYAQQVVKYPSLPATHSISNTATVGATSSVSLFGYATKYALVTLESNINIGTTMAKEDGEFRFSNVSIPHNTSEICLSYTDSSGNTSSSTCVPFSETYYGYSIGPIVLSPTITLLEAVKDVGEAMEIQGWAIPNQPVRLYTFSDNIVTWGSFLAPHKVHAIPPIETVADEHGHYTYSFKSETAQAVRIYTASSINNLSSDKSPALKADILPFYVIYIRKMALLFRTFVGNMQNILLLLELLLLYILICYYILPQKQRALMLRSSTLVLEKTAIALRSPAALVVKGVRTLLRQPRA